MTTMAALSRIARGRRVCGHCEIVGACTRGPSAYEKHDLQWVLYIYGYIYTGEPDIYRCGRDVDIPKSVL